jgi:uncharacterized protein YbjT (DUF2867 family)
MILVTMAAGNVGLPLVERLHATGAEVRAQTLEADRDRIPAGVPVIAGDIGDPEVLEAALADVDSLFLALGHPAEETPILKQAVRSGVRHVVALSSLAARDVANSPVSAEFQRIEESVRSSGLEWTILRPQGFASTMLSLGWLPMFRSGTVRAPFGAAPAVPVIHPADVAAVAFTALTEAGHTGRTYPLTGPQALTLAEQVEQIGEATGHAVDFEELTVEQAREELRAYAPGMVVDYFLKVWTEVRPDALSTVPDLTGRPARTFAQWAQENTDAFR